MKRYHQKQFIIVAIVVIIAIAIWFGVTGRFNRSTLINEFSGVITGVQYKVITMKGVYSFPEQMNDDLRISREITVEVTPEAKIYKQSRDPYDGKAVKVLVMFDELKGDIQQKKFVLAKIHANYDIYLQVYVIPNEIIYTIDPYVSIQ